MRSLLEKLSKDRQAEVLRVLLEAVDYSDTLDGQLEYIAENISDRHEYNLALLELGGHIILTCLY